jgi:NAD(P)-dependent dehydrogenase (short-subunit alcohol dehydrogenase family)
VTTAKTGLLGLVRSLAAELGPFGIRANMVVPGFIDTERRYAEWYPEFRQAPPGAPEQLKDIPLRRLGRPEDIADACVFLASDASSYVTGTTIVVDGVASSAEGARCPRLSAELLCARAARPRILSSS